MGVSPERATELALDFEGVSTAPHFDRTSFRTTRRIYATLNADAQDLNLMFTPDLRDHYCEMAPNAMVPVRGSWGVRGATRCDLTLIAEDVLRSALAAAYALALPAPPKPRRGPSN